MSPGDAVAVAGFGLFGLLALGVCLFLHDGIPSPPVDLTAGRKWWPGCDRGPGAVGSWRR